MNEEFDNIRLRALEETVFATAHAVETLIELLVDKAMISEEELIKKMNDLSEHEDIEEIEHDKTAPRDND